MLGCDELIKPLPKVPETLEPTNKLPNNSATPHKSTAVRNVIALFFFFFGIMCLYLRVGFFFVRVYMCVHLQNVIKNKQLFSCFCLTPKVKMHNQYFIATKNQSAQIRRIFAKKKNSEKRKTCAFIFFFCVPFAPTAGPILLAASFAPMANTVKNAKIAPIITIIVTSVLFCVCI